MKLRSPLFYGLCALFSILFTLSGCNRLSLNTIYQYELVNELKENTLMIPLQDHSGQIDLHEKYGQQAQADKLRNKDERVNGMIRNAFENYYKYSKFDFSTEQIEGSEYTCQFSKDKTFEGNDKTQDILKLTISQPAYRAISVDMAGTTFSQSSYNTLVQRMESKLRDMQEKAQSIKTQ